MDGDVGVELEPPNVGFDQLLHGPAGHGLWSEAIPALPTCRLHRPKQWAAGLVAYAGHLQPGFKPFLGLLVQRHQPFLSSLTVDFKDAVHTVSLVAADFQAG